MPIRCPKGQKPRYFVVVRGGKKVRIAKCGSETVEAKKLPKKKGKK